ncbi:uncharacterized protein LOC105703385 [Orussus abietinus]|uniref:uncharacterized protein LOC105703385 n=1 Tax=Orussus abietinus TaxID=222816 RepID=UPI000625044F|nr:uncharacterized protein LOC105703385 [Orussus abietinus]
MWKALRIGEKLLLKCKNAPRYRTFLSEAYQCQEIWNKRFELPTLQNVHVGNMFIEVDRKLSVHGQISAVDVDIFTHSIADKDKVDELVHLVHSLRLTPETSNTLESTSHALIRFLLEVGEIELLLQILDDRLNYGIFPDYFCYNIMMDRFIKEKDFASAAKVAALVMLQEDSGNPITNSFAIYSCHMHLNDPDKWKRVEEEKDDSTEEIKVRVKYLRNPYFDDHFDLREPSDLVGKTLAFFGKKLGGALGRSCQLRGLILYKKYAEINTLIKKWIEGGTKQVVFKEALQLAKNHLSGLPEDQVTDEVKELQNAFNTLEGCDLVEASFLQAIEDLVKTAVNEQADADILLQCENYVKWEEIRSLVLQQHLAELTRQKRIAQISEIKKDLSDRERILTFFEREEEIELEIEERNMKKETEKDLPLVRRSALPEGYVLPENVPSRK